MHVNKTLNIQLDDDAWADLQEGTPLQVPVDQEQSIVIYPPESVGEGRD